jgi:hypothetical protein
VVAPLVSKALRYAAAKRSTIRLRAAVTLQTGQATVLVGRRLSPRWRCLVYAAPVVPVAVIAASLVSSVLGLAVLEGQTWPLVLYVMSLGGFYSFVLPRGPASGEGGGIHWPD